MPGPHRPTPPDDDPGFEVVGDARPPAAKPLPAKPLPPRPAAGSPPAAKPLPPKPPAAKPLPAKPLPPAPAAKTAPPPKKMTVTLVDDDTVEDRRPVKKKSKARLADDDDEPVEARILDDQEDDGDDEDRPRKKKKKKKGKHGGKELSEAEKNFIEEWGGPLFLMGLGLIMLIVGTWGEYHGPHAEVSAGLVVALRLVFEAVTIPISIVMLMLIGSVMGIEYGTLGNAVRGLAAIGLMISGLGAVMDWVGIGFFIARPVIFIVSLGLLMTFFKLDVHEAMVTIFGMNLLSFAFTMLFIVVIVAMLISGAGRGGGDDGLDLDDRPDVQMKDNEFAPGGDEMMDDADEEDEPKPKRKGGRGQQRGRQPQPVPMGDPEFGDHDDNG